MGLDTTFDCWHGPYSSFNHWRTIIAQAAGITLECMEGFGSGKWWATEGEGELGTVKWESLPPSPLHLLLNHSDCDGHLRWEDCAAIADALEELLPRLPGDSWNAVARKQASQWITGLRAAAKAHQNVEFH
jgi:hypothetical protein